MGNGNFFTRLFGGNKKYKEKCCDILCQALDYLKDNPKVTCNPWPDYDGRVIMALDTLYDDKDYLKNHDKIETKEIESMSLREIATMYTFIKRGEKFCDGHIATYVENGMLYRLVKRHLELLGGKMKKMGIIIAIIGAVICLVGCGITFLGKPQVDPGGNYLDGDGMINEYAIESFTYQRGGGELGAFYNLYVTNSNELTVEECEGNGCKTYKKTYELPPEALSDMERILSQAGVRRWDDSFPDSEFFALDEETVSVRIHYCDGTDKSFNSNKVIPDNGWDAVNEVVTLLETVADK